MLQGLSRAQIAAGLTDPANPVTRAIVSSANYLSAVDLQDYRRSAGRRVPFRRGHGGREGDEDVRRRGASTLRDVPLLNLNPDELLSTTRAVRKRLDLTRPVPDELIRECVGLALQAPSGSNVVTMRFMVVTDQAKRRAIGDIYRECYEGYRASPGYAGAIKHDDDRLQAQQARVASSADFLGDHMGEAPALVLACNTGPNRRAASAGMGNVLPAAWSFMLAARARGLGTSWTQMHLSREQDVADVVGIPYETVAQAVLTPLAYTQGTEFKPALRPDPDQVIHWNSW